ncbi:endolytic transglycosylase MltG [Clostridium chromiireducens]|uniref:Endolytic murein transglycosylase n=1 Tax=Clostridium chromiireducens TaxID=225345 RepID=A0A399II09_9CLOT|nr:endolytic transglycosylase MltG [Clostridium chromiireducens]RII31859.1 endolytic transglycosylase MltG [Clostridium chromiireducens]
MMKKIIIMFTILIAVVLIGIGTLFYYFQGLNTVNKENSYLIINSESSLDDISKQLQDKSIIKSKDTFLLYTKLNRFSNNIKGGNFIVKPNTSYKELSLKLQSSQSDFTVVTIPEGFSFYQIAERLEKNTSIKKEDFLGVRISNLTTNSLVLNKTNIYYGLEGFLYPDTYYVPNGATEKEIANLMFDRFNSVFSDKYVDRAKELGLDINDVITIASLIEKEAANDSERSKIAGVIYNRKEKGIPLQIDASVIYAITKGESTMKKVLYDDLKVQDPYNTYVNKGLPPGPIASPGKPSIEAALYPEEHDYLYYVVNGSGGHVFSKTYEEHLNNVKKYIK